LHPRRGLFHIPRLIQFFTVTVPRISGWNQTPVREERPLGALGLSATIGKILICRFPAHFGLAAPRMLVRNRREFCHVNSVLSKTGVCVLDDDPSVLKSVQRLLKAEGFDAEKFSEPAAFLAAAAQSPCRVAILDVAMPQMNGLEVQAILRKTAPETRVVFLSGQGDASIRETALKNGAVDFLDKPCDDEELVAVVRKALNGAT
jgi:CheY-like chemotaxis protein